VREEACSILAQGRIGVIDAALVRWLKRQGAASSDLAVRVTGSCFEPLLPVAHLEEFLMALEPVGEVLCADSAPLGVRQWPESELLNYSLSRICKWQALAEEPIVSDKLTSVNELRQIYGPTPKHRHAVVGLVSGSFDLIHLGHVRLILRAKQQVDVLVVLTLSSSAIRQQEKNRLGDRPIYNERDRVEVLSAVRAVDHVVVFGDVNCLAPLRAFCPDRFIKSSGDRARPIVRAEAALVKELGGDVLYPGQHQVNYSSTTLVRAIRQYAAQVARHA
jgi:cytidyltransferase-like protein